MSYRPGDLADSMLRGQKLRPHKIKNYFFNEEGDGACAMGCVLADIAFRRGHAIGTCWDLGAPWAVLQEAFPILRLSDSQGRYLANEIPQMNNDTDASIETIAEYVRIREKELYVERMAR